MTNWDVHDLFSVFDTLELHVKNGSAKRISKTQRLGVQSSRFTGFPRWVGTRSTPTTRTKTILSATPISCRPFAGRRSSKLRVSQAQAHTLATFYHVPVFDNKVSYECIAGLDKLGERDLQRIQQQRLEEQRAELEKVKLRRLIREKEREEKQQMIELEERSRENEKFSKWQQEEDEFHLQQARLRSKVWK